MRDSDRRHCFKVAMIEAQSLVADLSLDKRVREAMGGYPSTTYGQMTSRSQESPVEAQALNKHDPAQADLKLLDDIARRVKDLMLEAGAVRRRYPPPRRGTVERSDAPGCELCHREKRWSAPKGDPTDVAGVLSRPYLLCSTCIKLVANLGRLPKPHEHTEAHEHGRVKVRSTK